MNPLDRLANGTVRQFRPKYPRGGRGVANNFVTNYSLVQTPTDGADGTPGSFPAMVQVFGHQASDQAAGDVVQDMWSFWCLSRDVRQGDLFLLYMYTGYEEVTAGAYDFTLPFFVRAEDYTAYPLTGYITTFMRVFGIGVAPPDGYNSETATLPVTQ